MVAVPRRLDTGAGRGDWLGGGVLFCCGGDVGFWVGGCGLVVVGALGPCWTGAGVGAGTCGGLDTVEGADGWARAREGSDTTTVGAGLAEVAGEGRLGATSGVRNAACSRPIGSSTPGRLCTLGALEWPWCGRKTGMAWRRPPRTAPTARLAAPPVAMPPRVSQRRRVPEPLLSGSPRAGASLVSIGSVMVDLPVGDDDGGAVYCFGDVDGVGARRRPAL